MNSIHFIRHATLVIRLGNNTILVDPMLSPKNAMEPIQNAGNETRIPMIELPMGSDGLQALIKETDAVLITHLHRDHWDLKAQEIIPRDKVIFCQPPDQQTLLMQGFTDVRAVHTTLDFNGITLNRTGGRHGTGEIGKKMGPVSGFVLQFEKLVLYLGGDTIWCEEVKQVLTNFTPQFIVVNAGGAQFTTGDPITMTDKDVAEVCMNSDGQCIAVHMNTINHCRISKDDLRFFLEKSKLSDRVKIPGEGETIILENGYET